jgi:uncharacterized membrane protein YvbJ
MFCTKCGTNLSSDAKFCAECGTGVADDLLGIAALGSDGLQTTAAPLQRAPSTASI